MENIWENHKLSIMAVAAVIIVLLMSVVIVPEEQQAVVVRTGEPVRVINRFEADQPYGETGAGMVLKIPLVEQVQFVDKRVLDLDMEREQVLSSDQQRLLVDAYARFRIIDPVLMVETAGTTDGVRTQLEPILNSVLRQELGRRTFASLLTAERGQAMSNIREKLDVQAREYGAQVIDVRIKRTDLPDGTPLESAFRRMKTDREREARTIRAQGERNARVIRAEADAEAARVYADSFGKDPGFYDFYRAMQSYDTTFAKGEGQGQSQIILSPDNEYLRQFRNGQ
ncbi:protease modulator HflC [Allopontixanthobacter sediminis]|uniref:Protein HflC n=1 Tax=Allopontixanthobacter sediminis TaxID=1689985 RepID=A0A845B2P0_9SPHN|nr:protease modulator HflC [Allopontixanthobacter sediminis]MXP45521.1 protease modulator HflC [Allopontixanthobacter sediminis]